MFIYWGWGIILKTGHVLLLTMAHSEVMPLFIFSFFLVCKIILRKFYSFFEITQPRHIPYKTVPPIFCFAKCLFFLINSASSDVCQHAVKNLLSTTKLLSQWKHENFDRFSPWLWPHGKNKKDDSLLISQYKNSLQQKKNTGDNTAVDGIYKSLV